MSWNHRVVKEVLEDGTEWFSVREVFYNEDGSIFAYTENPVDISGESIDELRKYCQYILASLDKEVLVDGEVVFVNRCMCGEPATINREWCPACFPGTIK